MNQSTETEVAAVDEAEEFDGDKFERKFLKAAIEFSDIVDAIVEEHKELYGRDPAEADYPVEQWHVVDRWKKDAHDLCSYIEEYFWDNAERRHFVGRMIVREGALAG